LPGIISNGIRIEYDTFGESSSPPLLLIMGLGGQMILWDEEFCRKLAERGFYLIRFDNRDTGLSDKFDEIGQEEIGELFLTLMRGGEVKPPYTLDDMAEDAMGLLDGLGIGKAHVCGASMGGMIAQVMAIKYPERLASLTSMSSATGSPGPSSEQAINVEPLTFPLPVPVEREANIEFTLKGMRELSGPGFPFDENSAREAAEASYDRCFCPLGAERQLLAILLSGNRKPALSKLEMPVLVVHGDSDPLVSLERGLETAEAVPGARLCVVKGMGHDLPRGAWGQIIDAISGNANRGAC